MPASTATPVRPPPFTPKDTTSFLVMTPSGSIAFSSDTVERAVGYRDTRHPTWSVVGQTISYSIID